MRNLVLGILVLTILTGSALASEAKSLVVVFSHTGENYNVGYIEKGNTMLLAEMIAHETGSELFEVKPVKPYPTKYDDCTDLAKREQNQNARPAILEDKDISEYDTIFFGYPIWWGDIPMCMYTFIEAHDWNGKRIVPFCTHEGSGAGRTERTLTRSMKGAKVLKPFSMYGSTAQKKQKDAEKEISLWLNGLQLWK
ncbi:MAG: NAD(P)H-dependent oxidoreductase [Synergistaceae bacterium]|nr:NAD(P)H-dependent oxidoreductase [Synergistaceae bacterium]MBQ9903897.1 NAD(P)H-dependent oxidoreductase [Synergistaceae bacterium]